MERDGERVSPSARDTRSPIDFLYEVSLAVDRGHIPVVDGVADIFAEVDAAFQERLATSSELRRFYHAKMDETIQSYVAQLGRDRLLGCQHREELHARCLKTIEEWRLSGDEQGEQADKDLDAKLQELASRLGEITGR